jgi:hypothetical protein
MTRLLPSPQTVADAVAGAAVVTGTVATYQSFIEEKTPQTPQWAFKKPVLDRLKTAGQGTAPPSQSTPHVFAPGPGGVPVSGPRESYVNELVRQGAADREIGEELAGIPYTGESLNKIRPMKRQESPPGTKLWSPAKKGGDGGAGDGKTQGRSGSPAKRERPPRKKGADPPGRTPPTTPVDPKPGSWIYDALRKNKRNSKL